LTALKQNGNLTIARKIILVAPLFDFSTFEFANK